MRVLVVGHRGQLGHELTAGRLRGAEVIGRDLPELDLLDGSAVRAAFEDVEPDVVINAAGYTAVDAAEDDEATAMAVNAEAPARLASICATLGTALVHVSTDYVFDGRKQTPYTEEDPVAPLGVYGRSKEAGERAIRDRLDAHFIVRTAWLFGAHGTNFVKTMLRLGAERDALSVVDDQTGCPTAAASLAAAIGGIVASLRRGERRFGTYHYAGAEATTWYGFAKVIFEEAARRGRHSPQLTAITTSQYPTRAPRPPYSALDSARFERTFGVPAADWRRGLDAVLTELIE